MAAEQDSSIGFKEWAAVGEALATGEQTLLLRKGGIQEQGDEFRVEHDRFWLLETNFHQSPDELTDRGQRHLQAALQTAPPRGVFHLRLWCQVVDIHWVDSLSQLTRLASEHILAESTVRKRFEYRSPGVFVLSVRVYHAPETWSITETPEMAGCRSWVPLPQSQTFSTAQPVLNDDQFALRRRQIAESVELCDQ